MTISTEAAQSPQISSSRAWKVGIIAVVVAVIANVLFVALAKALFDLPEGYRSLELPAIAIFTALFSFIGVVVFVLLLRYTEDPIRIFRIVAIIALVVSILPDIALLAAPADSPMAGATVGAVVVLIIAHLIAGAIMIYALTTKTIES
ncbi:MAG: hypothetical protein GY762_20545 [Proteobacteria bacterium]|nr:hypothetical protein [Pseudomonadota bacterium]